MLSVWTVIPDSEDEDDSLDGPCDRFAGGSREDNNTPPKTANQRSVDESIRSSEPEIRLGTPIPSSPVPSPVAPKAKDENEISSQFYTNLRFEPIHKIPSRSPPCPEFYAAKITSIAEVTDHKVNLDTRRIRLQARFTEHNPPMMLWLEEEDIQRQEPYAVYKYWETLGGRREAVGFEA